VARHPGGRQPQPPPERRQGSSLRQTPGHHGRPGEEEKSCDEDAEGVADLIAKIDRETESRPTLQPPEQKGATAGSLTAPELVQGAGALLQTTRQARRKLS
jgi:hypothetical protein